MIRLEIIFDRDAATTNAIVSLRGPWSGAQLLTHAAGRTRPHVADGVWLRPRAEGHASSLRRAPSQRAAAGFAWASPRGTTRDWIGGLPALLLLALAARMKPVATAAFDGVEKPAVRLADPFIVRKRVRPFHRRGRLAGFKCAAKDNFDVAGIATGNGSPDWGLTRGATPSTHAPAVAALLNEGARLVGKTHMDELAFSIAGENMHFGSLDNPRAEGRSVGG